MQAGNARGANGQNLSPTQPVVTIRHGVDHVAGDGECSIPYVTGLRERLVQRVLAKGLRDSYSGGVHAL